MPINIERCRRCLKETGLAQLFIDELGWDRCSSNPVISVDGRDYTLNAIAQKRGLAAFAHTGKIPDYPTRRKIEREITRAVHEHLIVFIDAQKTTQIWQWVSVKPANQLPAANILITAASPGTR